MLLFIGNNNFSILKMDKKIVFYGLKDWEREYISKNSTFENVNFLEGLLSDTHLPKEESDTEILSVFVDSVIDEKVLEKFPNLKFISTRSTGYDHINVKECEKRKIVVSNVPSYGENTVAEFAFALLLSLSRKIYESYDRIRETGSWSLEGLQGFDLLGKNIGIVGTGRIGKHSIKIAKGFGMNVVAYDKFEDKEFAKENHFKYLPFEELLKVSDIVFFHVPYLPETHHMLNGNTLSLIKKGVYIINTSRGSVVDTTALVKGLKEGIIGGAGLDVFEEEGVIKDEMDFLFKGHPKEHDLKTVVANHLLIDMPNVVITPHNAFNTKEALQRILDTTILNIKNFLSGKIENRVG